MFAQMMIPHHQQAVEMSDVILAKAGIDPEVKTLAEQIKAAQLPEIGEMTSWLTGWRRPTDGGRSHGGSGGMMSAEDMKTLKQADAASGQKLYLQSMIKHHQGAVTMAQDEIRYGKNPDALALAKNVVETQTAEITTMRALGGRL